MIPASLRAAALSALLLSPLPPAAAEAAPAVESFFQKPLMTGAAISPNGRQVALRLLSPSSRKTLAIYDTATNAQRLIGNFGDADVSSFYWLSDKRLAFTVANVDGRFEMGDPGLYAIDADGKNLEFLSAISCPKPSFADPDLRSTGALMSTAGHGFPYRKSEAVMALAADERRTWLVRVDTRTGTKTPVRMPRLSYNWLIDKEGEARIAVARHDGKDTVYLAKGNDWEEITSFDPYAPEAFEPLLYLDGQLLVRSYHGRDAAAIYRYDLASRTLQPKPVVELPGFDVDGVFILSDKGTLGFRMATDRENTLWEDERMAAAQREIDALLPGVSNTLSVGERSETPYVLVDTHSDKQPHAYLLYDRDAKKLIRLGEAKPGIDAARMSAVEATRYAARDGLPIPTYVTLPAGAPKQPLPTVVLMPETYNQTNGAWDWDAETQFLASRGYVVLRPSPRGTAGFGITHEMTGAKQWGLAIQDDIADAVKWAVRQGYTDPARVCIAGSSYGGYAAMMGLIRDPGLFKCGVSWSGIVDLNSMFEREWEATVPLNEIPRMLAMVGDPARDAAQFKQTSPLQNAALVKQPVLLAYGMDDVRVPYHEGRRFYEKVAAGNPGAEWLAYTPSVEDSRTQKNRIDLWRKIEAFLAKHIGNSPALP